MVMNIWTEWCVCNAGAQFGTVNSSRLVGYTQNGSGVCLAGEIM